MRKDVRGCNDYSENDVMFGKLCRNNKDDILLLYASGKCCNLRASLYRSGNQDF